MPHFERTLLLCPWIQSNNASQTDTTQCQTVPQHLRSYHIQIGCQCRTVRFQNQSSKHWASAVGNVFGLPRVKQDCYQVQLLETAVSIVQIFQNVRTEVIKVSMEIGKLQSTVEESKLTGDVYYLNKSKN